MLSNDYGPSSPAAAEDAGYANREAKDVDHPHVPDGEVEANITIASVVTRLLVSVAIVTVYSVVLVVVAPATRLITTAV